MLTTQQEKPKIATTPTPRQLQDAVKRMIGQTDQANGLYIAVLIDLIDRVQQLENGEQMPGPRPF